MREHRYFVYILASRSHTLYVGFTSALEQRIRQHQDGTYEGFSKRYRCNRLVYFETHDDVHRAIAREKQLKRWSRPKKIVLIERHNPAWYDLSEDWGSATMLQCKTSLDTKPTGLFTPASPPVEMTLNRVGE